MQAAMARPKIRLRDRRRTGKCGAPPIKGSIVHRNLNTTGWLASGQVAPFASAGMQRSRLAQAE
jgi:hypothetical protein